MVGGIRKEESLEDIYSFSYPSDIYFRTSYGGSNKIFVNLGQDGYIKFGNSLLIEGTFGDDFNFEVYTVDGKLKYSLNMKEGEDANTGLKNLINGFNNAKIKSGDYFKVTGMKNKRSLNIGFISILPGEEFTFTQNAIIKNNSAVQKYSTKITLGGYVSFNG